MRWLLAALLVIVAVDALAAPTNAVTAITVQKDRQLTSVAIKAIVQGDDDSSAVCRIFQRWQGGAFDTGMVMVRRIHGPLPGIAGPASAGAAGEIFEGRILNMTPGRIAEYWIEVTDAAGKVDAFSSVAPDTTSAAVVRQQVATGPVYYVNQSTGNDNNSGSATRPKRTISAALTALAASTNQGANGGIFVAPGEYHETLTLGSSLFPTNGGRAGDALGQRFIAGTSASRDSTIICGAHPLVEQGFVATGRRLVWTFTGQDSTWKAYFPSGDSCQQVVIGWNETLHRKTSIKAILDDSTYAYTGASLNTGELSGWWWQNDTLYVKRKNGRSPAGITLHAGYYDNLIAVQTRNFRIANLTLRFAGGRSNNGDVFRANTDPGMNGRGVVAGLVRDGSGLVVDSCSFIGLNADAVYVNHGAGPVIADSVVVANCYVDGLTVGWMAYAAGKARAEEDACQIKLASWSAVAYNNTITGAFNGIQAGPGGSGQADSTWGSRCEVANNTITNCADDAIELDTTHGLNTLVYGNTSRRTGSGLSQAPIYTGPVFVLSNLFSNFTSMGVKGSGGSTGIARYQHNTITSSVSGTTAIDLSPGGSTDGLFFENNILAGSGTYSVMRGPSSGGSITRNLLNWNLMDPTQTTKLVQWNGSDFSLAQLRATNGWEANGLQGSGAYVDSTRYNYSLGPSSPALLVGKRLSGINRGLDGARYTAATPAVGSEQRVIP